MGHLVGKDLYQRVGEKLDGLEVRAPMNEHLYAVLKEIFTPREAEIFCMMPYSLSTKKRISRITKIEAAELEKILYGMSSKGLIMDLFINGENQYMPSPMVIGIFEFTMMRTGGDVNFKRLAKLLHDNFKDGTFFETNLKGGARVGPLRTMPYEASVNGGEYTQIFEYEKAYELVEKTAKFAIGICSCRHEKHHVGEKNCEIRLETCVTFDLAADSLIRNKLAREASKTEALENLTYAIENGLVVLADNVKKNVSFMCHCCGCCCNALGGISKHGYANTVVTSTFIAQSDEQKCTSCGKCVKACPIDAIRMVETEEEKKPQIDTGFCLGCGVCAVACKSQALHLVKRGERVLHPENTFERILLQCLERGTLQNQIFDNQNNITMKFMSGLVGGFLRLSPVKKALMSDLLRSQFLSVMRMGVKLQGKGWMTEM